MRETKIQRMKVAEMRPADYNPRRISADAMAGLRASVQRFGLVQPIIVNERTGNVVGGHQRLKVLTAEGVDEVDVVVVDLPSSEERALNVALNNPHISGEFSDDLGPLLQQIAEDEPELFEALRLDELDFFADEDEPEPEGGAQSDDFDADEDLPVVTRRGDVWVMGDHRLICGDCREPDDVRTLLGGDKVNIAFTSPPYASQRKYDEASGFKPIHPDEYVEWFEAVQANVGAHLADDGSWFVNIKAHCQDGQRHLYVHDLVLAHVRRWGWRFVDELCWRDKKNGVPGGWNNRFKDAWEPVFHFSRNASIRFNPLANGTVSDAVFDYSADTAKTATGSGLLGVKATDERRGIARPSNVIEIAAASTGKHSAAFPVDLPAWFIRAYSNPGDLILDPFMGSGTTIIACEKEGRRGYGTEISPRYCDIIVRRWEAYTGKQATLGADGRRFVDVEQERVEP